MLNDNDIKTILNISFPQIIKEKNNYEITLQYINTNFQYIIHKESFQKYKEALEFYSKYNGKFIFYEMYKRKEK